VPRTIELYSQSVRYFSRWLTEHDRPATLDELTRHAISAWLAELAETCEPSTVGTRLRGMRRFCPWLVTEVRTGEGPHRRHRDPRATGEARPGPHRRRDRRPAQGLLGPRGRPGVFDRATFLGRRDQVVLRLLLDTGVRVFDLCGLELTDVDLDWELAYVTGKGSRPRVVPFGAKTAQAVDRYLRVRGAASLRALAAAAARSARPDDPRRRPRRAAHPRRTGRRRRRPPAPLPAHLGPSLARRRRSGAGPDDACRLALGRHAVPLRRLNRR
jgi:site-specific recombinase XerD